MSQLASRLAFTFDDYLDCPVEVVYEDRSEPPVMGFAEPERRP